MSFASGAEAGLHTFKGRVGVVTDGLDHFPSIGTIPYSSLRCAWFRALRGLSHFTLTRATCFRFCSGWRFPCLLFRAPRVGFVRLRLIRLGCSLHLVPSKRAGYNVTHVGQAEKGLATAALFQGHCFYTFPAHRKHHILTESCQGGGCSSRKEFPTSTWLFKTPTLGGPPRTHCMVTAPRDPASFWSHTLSVSAPCLVGSESVAFRSKQLFFSPKVSNGEDQQEAAARGDVRRL